MGQTRTRDEGKAAGTVGSMKIDIRCEKWCPACGEHLRDKIRTAYGWRASCGCRDVRWTYIRRDDFVHAEKR